MKKVNLDEELGHVIEHWSPRVVAALNGQEVKVAKFQGEFPWHHHEDEDEMFLGLKGEFVLEFRDKRITVRPGEFVVVPKGVEHRPVSEEEVEVLLFEPAGVRNTGNVYDEEFTSK